VANDPTIPSDVRLLVSDLWRAYCFSQASAAEHQTQEKQT